MQSYSFLLVANKILNFNPANSMTKPNVKKLLFFKSLDKLYADNKCYCVVNRYHDKFVKKFNAQSQ